jgi:broad specificity phosphatase PhoE
MTTWHWIRHGPTHEKNFVGWRDVPADLSDTVTINRLRAALPKRAVLVASDLSRASQTATAIDAGHERLPDHHELREFHFGDWDGRHFSEISQQHPELSRAYWEHPGDVVPPGGESWNMAAARVGSAVARLTQAHRGRDIIAVAHFGVILTQIQAALGVSAADVLAHRIEPLSLTRIRFEPDGSAKVELINHQP